MSSATLTESANQAGKAARPTSSRQEEPLRGLRVLHLIDTLQIGGTETQMTQLACRLAMAGHDVTVGCLRAEGPLISVLQKAGLQVVEFRKERTLISLNGFRQLLRLAMFLRNRKFDVLHAHDLWSNLLGVPAARLARIPVIISSRRYLADLAWYTPWRDKIMGLIYRLSTCVVVNSTAVRTLLLARHKIKRDHIQVIPNGVDMKRFAEARADRRPLLPMVTDTARVIAVLANMYSAVKGHLNLIAAASLVCRAEPKTLFVLIGDGAERAKLEQKVAALNLQNSLVFLGRRHDVPELLSCCDISVLPSAAEGFPNAILESMSAGLPVIATAAGGAEEMIENRVNGLLVAPNDPILLAEAILTLLQNPSLARDLAKAGQERVRISFSLDRLLDRVERLYSLVPRPAESR